MLKNVPHVKKRVSFILSTTGTPPPRRDSAMSIFSIFIHQNTKRTTVLYIYSILGECPKALLKCFFLTSTV